MTTYELSPLTTLLVNIPQNWRQEGKLEPSPQIHLQRDQGC